MIELKEVSCSFSDGFGGKGLFTAVSPLSAHFSDGGRYAIVGESGSGKTTLARMIAGLQRPSGGSVFVDGAPVYGRKRAGKEHFRKVQIIQQNSASALDPKIPVGKSIEEPLHCFFHMEKEKRRERCPELDGALQSITGLLYPSSIRTVRRRTKAGGNRQGTGR